MNKNPKKWKVTIEGVADEDMKELAKMAGSCGISAGELLGNFVNDLIGGIYSNGSDERDIAHQWFDRCWFSICQDYTFLHYLTEHDFLDVIIDSFEGIRDSRKYITQGKERLKDKDYAWQKITTSKGTQIYSDRKKWEDEERDSIENEKERIMQHKQSIRECWKDYLKEPQYGIYQRGTFIEEMKKVLKWSEQNQEFLRNNDSLPGSQDNKTIA